MQLSAASMPRLGSVDSLPLARADARPAPALKLVQRASTQRFAITYTVKNEAALLPRAISYHLRSGCARVYVFFDGTTDATRELIQGMAGVVCAESVVPQTLTNPPAWIQSILPMWQQNMDVRKRINTFVAAQQARQEGIEWLINIDPDELLMLGDTDDRMPADCERFFASVPQHVDQILLPNLEAIPVDEGSSGCPFIDCTLFLRRYPLTELLWRCSAAAVRRLVPSSKVHAWFDYWFYRVRFAGALPRLMRHPTTGEAIPVGYFLGYSNHKAFIRTRVATEFNFNIHRWQEAHRRPRSIKQGNVLHYDLCSAEYFYAKFRQRQPSMVSKVFFSRYMFASIARDLPLPEVRRFFLEYICLRDARVVARLKRRGILNEIDFISQLMSSGEFGAAAPAGQRSGVLGVEQHGGERGQAEPGMKMPAGRRRRWETRPQPTLPVASATLGTSLEAQPPELA